MPRFGLAAGEAEILDGVGFWFQSEAELDVTCWFAVTAPGAVPFLIGCFCGGGSAGTALESFVELPGEVSRSDEDP